MKYVDYYKVLGLERSASQDDIKKAYRRLAHKHHPDVSGNAGADEKFKEIAQAYATLKDPEKRAAYDELGPHGQGEDFVPPRQWRQQFHETSNDFADVDLADLLAAFAAARHAEHHGRSQPPARGPDYEVPIPITLEQVYSGARTDVTVAVPDYDASGLLHRTPKTFSVHIPKGATDGQRLRLPGKGGAGARGGKPGDLYLVMNLQSHPLYRPSGTDLYIDLPLAPWEAVLGASVRIPTLGGPVDISIPPGTVTERKLRLAKRGLPTSNGAQGDLYAVCRIDVPHRPTARERALFQQLASESVFNPRAQLYGGATS
ncbi:MAG TPA: DnaJ C-terminal domain-containing protein [Candidimonas sp.]|nr:DnaJ C-terminal domain-containing protein [Candidimonas sp.]